MRTVALVVMLALGLLLAPLAAGAQQPAGKIYRIGWLSGTVPAGSSDLIAGFREGLRQLGYVEGKSIVIEYRFAEGRTEQLPTLAVELVSLNVDVLLAQGTPVTLAAKRATATIPIVIVGPSNPVEVGLIASLARPGGNVTGVSSGYVDVAAKWVELLREVVPKASRIGYLENLDNLANQTFVKHVMTAGRTLGVAVRVFSATKPDEVERQLTAIAKARVQAILVSPDAVLRTKRKETVEFAAKAHLPAMYGGRDYVDDGGLMSYSPSRPEMGRQAATYVDKILKGAKPADLPVEEPTKFELVINMRTAKALGLTIPQSVLIRADEVIQ